MRRIATPNDNGNSGSSIATPSKLHNRGRDSSREIVRAAVAYTETCVRKAPLVGGIARKIESYNSAYRLA